MVRFIDAVECSNAVRVASRLGHLMPSNCTSTGKAMVAQLSVEELRELFPQEQLETLTPNSISSRTDLELELAMIRRRGYATSHEESRRIGVVRCDGLAPVDCRYGTPSTLPCHARG